MSFSFCLNKNEMLTLCGLSLLYQGLDLKQEGKLMQDGQRLVIAVIKYLEKSKAPGAADFKRLAASMIKLDVQPKTSNGRENTMPAPTSTKSTPSPSATRKQLQPQLYRHASATMSESDLLSQQEKLRRATLPSIAMHSPEIRQYGRTSMDSARSESPVCKREYRSSASQLPTMLKPQVNKAPKPPNLDYLSLSNTPLSSQPQSPAQRRSTPLTQTSHGSMCPTSTYSGPKPTANPTEWEVLLGSFDDRHLYDAIYGGGPAPALSMNDTTTSNYGAWSPDSWDYTSISMGDFANTAPDQSVLSFSEESLSSGEELSPNDLGFPGTNRDYKLPILPGNVSSNDGYGYLLDSLDGTFGL